VPYSNLHAVHSPGTESQMARLQDLVPQYLHTERLTLELYNHSKEHCDTFLAAMNSKSSHEAMGDHGIRTPEQFDAIHANTKLKDHRFKNGVANDDLFYLIRLGSNAPQGKLVGGVALNQRTVSGRTLPPDMGWCVLEPEMGKGYATEAAREFLRWATEDFGLPGVSVYYGAGNPRSNRVADKLGFVSGGGFPDGDQPGKFYSVGILPGMERIEIKEPVFFAKDISK